MMVHDHLWHVRLLPHPINKVYINNLAKWGARAAGVFPLLPLVHLCLWTRSGVVLLLTVSNEHSE